MSRVNQKTRLLEYLQDIGHINPLESWQYLGIYRLSDVIFQLRGDGYDIETQQAVAKNKYDEVVKFAKYVYKDKN